MCGAVNLDMRLLLGVALLLGAAGFAGSVGRTRAYVRSTG